MKRDIENREDIKLIVDRFYDKVKTDEVIGFIFNDIAKVNWEKHLPVMYDFWENAIFYSGTYSGNPMSLHHHLHHIRPLATKHFTQWNKLFDETVDENFEGEKAKLIKQRAFSISIVMQQKIFHVNTDAGHL